LRKKLVESHKLAREHKKKVSYHFSKTASLINELTENYHRIHKHLSVGVRQFSDKSTGTIHKIVDVVDPVYTDLYSGESEADDVLITEPIDYVSLKKPHSSNNFIEDDFRTDDTLQNPQDEPDKICYRENIPCE
jgi:hypothetical protein